MATITVLKFETADGAEKALDVVKDLSKQHLINLHDAAIVTWPQGEEEAKNRTADQFNRCGDIERCFLGDAFRADLFCSYTGPCRRGATVGALTGSMADIGIDDDFIRSIRSKVTEGTSALFLMTSDAVQDRVAEVSKGMKFELIASNLSREEEDKLRAVFAEE